MEPVNNKSLLHFVFAQMEKLDKGEIDVEQAKAQANLSKQANNALRYELDRTKLQIRVNEYNKATGASLSIRNAEGKNFE